jgi:hypothetical protein
MLAELYIDNLFLIQPKEMKDDIYMPHLINPTRHKLVKFLEIPAVSRAMRDAVAGTGLRFAELGERRAVELGCLSAVQRLQRRGLLSRQEYLSGSGEEWTARRVAGAARGRLAVGLKHVRGGGIWREPRGVAVGARERLPLERLYVCMGGGRWAPRYSAVGARERLPVG